MIERIHAKVSIVGMKVRGNEVGKNVFGNHGNGVRGNHNPENPTSHRSSSCQTGSLGNRALKPDGPYGSLSGNSVRCTSFDSVA